MPPVELPTTRAAQLLVLALPGVLFAGWHLARWVTRQRLLAAILAPGCALALYIELAHLVAFASRSFQVGLFTSTIGCAAVGYWAWSRPDWRPRRATLRRLASRRMLWLWGSALVATALLAPIVLGAAFHDEVGTMGHLSNISTLQNGHYPPRDLIFPQVELKYHYGYDLLCAMLGAIWRTNASVTSDIVTISAWAYSFTLAWILGVRKGGRFAGPIAALLVLYGAGTPLYCPEQVRSDELGAQLLGFCSVGGTLTNPPFISYHFQHPWTVGLPLGLTTLILFDAAPRSWRRVGAFTLLLASLAISQFVLFASLCVALPAAEVVRRQLRDDRGIAQMVVASGLALGVASQTGGFFASTAAAGMGLELHPGIAATPKDSVKWMLETFGLVLPLGLLGLLTTKKPRMVFLLLTLGGLAVINTVRYKLSWDIVKFATVASIGLAIPAASLLARALRARLWALKGLAVAALAASTASGFAFQYALLFRLPGVPPMYQRVPPGVPHDDALAAGWLRVHMPRGTVVYRRKDKARPYALWAGLPQVWPESAFVSMLAFARAREELLRSLPADPQPWLDQRIRFFVLEPGDARVAAIVDDWIRSGRAVERARFGDLRVVELRPIKA